MNTPTKQKNRKKIMDDDLNRWRGESPAAGRATEIKATSKKEREHHKDEPPQRREASKT